MESGDGRRGHVVVEKLCAFVAEGAHRGMVLEAQKKAPKGLELGTATTRVGRWLKGAPFKVLVPDFVPASYRLFLQMHGSLTWLAPDTDAPEGAFSLQNTGAWTLVDLPDANGCIDLHELAGEEASEHLWVFHDGYSDSFAFDARVKNERGDALVIRFEDHHLMQPFEERELETLGTFDDWLAARVDHFIALLQDRAPRPKVKQLVEVPADITVPVERAHDEKAFHLALMRGLQQVAAGDLPGARATAKKLLSMSGSLYALSLALDASEDPEERRRLGWQMLASCRAGTSRLHADYLKLYRQRSATVLAELALSQPTLVSMDDAKLLIVEARAVRVGKDEQTAMTGAWDTVAVAKRLESK
ncbi:SMI1/KNR4 family protein [Myxococcus sp. K38C18041901]|uniref:SMI1/KNR4 family protein n=1 Tax=Myxococcus guangdongensis TaxID=2906760 RepID=UPI0020A7E989|nr:SMI1/KNR4 family protein [Myxococcus guangdongensis]MCP3063600.1 SMI1/KNR4 family protein [Myxococcus guangdongensis]